MRMFHAFRLEHSVPEALVKAVRRTPGLTDYQLLIHPLDRGINKDDKRFDFTPVDPVVQRGHFYIEILEVVKQDEDDDDNFR